MLICYLPIAPTPYNIRHKMAGPLDPVLSVTIHNTAENFSAREERDPVAAALANAGVIVC